MIYGLISRFSMGCLKSETASSCPSICVDISLLEPPKGVVNFVKFLEFFRVFQDHFFYTFFTSFINPIDVYIIFETGGRGQQRAAKCAFCSTVGGFEPEIFTSKRQDFVHLTTAGLPKCLKERLHMQISVLL